MKRRRWDSKTKTKNSTRKFIRRVSQESYFRITCYLTGIQKSEKIVNYKCNY